MTNGVQRVEERKLEIRHLVEVMGQHRSKCKNESVYI